MRKLPDLSSVGRDGLLDMIHQFNAELCDLDEVRAVLEISPGKTVQQWLQDIAAEGLSITIPATVLSSVIQARNTMRQTLDSARDRSKELREQVIDLKAKLNDLSPTP